MRLDKVFEGSQSRAPTDSCRVSAASTRAREILVVSVDQSVTWEADAINPLPGPL